MFDLVVSVFFNEGEGVGVILRMFNLFIFVKKHHTLMVIILSSRSLVVTVVKTSYSKILCATKQDMIPYPSTAFHAGFFLSVLMMLTTLTTTQYNTIHKLTCRTLRIGSGKPTPPFQQGSELSTGNGLQSNKPGNTT